MLAQLSLGGQAVQIACLRHLPAQQPPHPDPALPWPPPCCCSIRAAHCLTSVQFSPCCDHVLLAYGGWSCGVLAVFLDGVGGFGMGRRSICRCCGKTKLEDQLTPPTPLHAGKKHISLLRSLVADRGSVLPLHTILEVFR